ncbi:MAG: cell division protein FtsA [Chloroflexi bacterium]|nr:cell division protein FtsA [Chloroflexota bacterium]
MARERLTAGLDIGTTKTCAILAEHRTHGKLQVLAAGVCPSRGLKRGVVVSLEETSASIQTAIEQCERLSGHRIGSAVVSIAGSHVESQNTRGVTTLANNGQDLTAADLQKALDSARAVALPPNREIIHVVPRSFVLDGQDGIKNPIGMSGQRLEAETHVITGAVGSIQNLIKAVQRTGLEIDDLVLQPLASSEAVVTIEERELGCVLVDIGGGTTDIALFLDGSVWHTAVIPVGGANVTNDIAICLRIPLHRAEELKIAYGHTDPASVIELPPVDVPTFERNQVQQVPRDYLAQIIQARMEEILGMVASELHRSGYGGLLGAGIVLTGGVAEQSGIRELAESILDLPVRIGQPQGVERLDDRLAGPAFATATGLLLWAQRNGAVSRAPAGNGFRLGAAAGKAGRWLRAFLP